MLLGTHLIHHWSNTQANVALSVAEAELNAIVKGAVEAIGMKNMIKEFGHEVQMFIFTDSSAATGILHRSGCGKLKHLEAKQLWVQEAVANKNIKIVKIPRAQNISDALTHHWTVAEASVHFPSASLSVRGADSTSSVRAVRGGVLVS